MKKPGRIEMIFLGYLASLLLLFLWAGVTGTRIVGDGTEVYKPEGKPQLRTHGITRSYHRTYHK